MHTIRNNAESPKNNPTPTPTPNPNPNPNPKMMFYLSYVKGNVPPELGTFGDFFGVQMLNLSENQLTGIAPNLFFPLTHIHVSYEGKET
jgi:hypothetical protein